MLPALAGGDHAVKVITLFKAGACYPFISVNTGHDPVGIFLYFSGIMLHLRFVACELFLIVRADAAVSGDTQLAGFWFARLVQRRIGRIYRTSFLAPVPFKSPFLI